MALVSNLVLRCTRHTYVMLDMCTSMQGVLNIFYTTYLETWAHIDMYRETFTVIRLYNLYV